MKFVEKNLANLANSVELKFLWEENNATLTLNLIQRPKSQGAVIYYENPPVHTVDTGALNAYNTALEWVDKNKDSIDYLIFCSPPDMVHAGGDLKETLARMKNPDTFYEWADTRLQTAFTLYCKVRQLNAHMKTIAICGGGTRYGGSAEIPLWCDYLVGDFRSSMCFSEVLIGLIPGWGGVGRLLTKAGYLNTRYIVETAPIIPAEQLKYIGVYDTVVSRITPTDSEKTICALFSAAFDIVKEEKVRKEIAQRDLILRGILETEKARRVDPQRYRAVWGMPIAKAKQQTNHFEPPLAPQSFDALQKLFWHYCVFPYIEKNLIRYEMALDASLYRDPQLKIGIEAMLNKTVPNFSDKPEE